MLSGEKLHKEKLGLVRIARIADDFPIICQALVGFLMSAIKT